MPSAFRVLRKPVPTRVGTDADLFDVRLDKPQEFIQVTGSRGEDISRILILNFGDRLAYIVSDNTITVGQGFQMILHVWMVVR